MEGTFYPNATSLGRLEYLIFIHKKIGQCHILDFRRREGWSIGAAMQSYWWDKVNPRDSLTVIKSDTVEYRHEHLTILTVTQVDKILHGLHLLTGVLVKCTYCSFRCTIIGNYQFTRCLPMFTSPWFYHATTSRTYGTYPAIRAKLPRRSPLLQSRSLSCVRYKMRSQPNGW